MKNLIYSEDKSKEISERVILTIKQMAFGVGITAKVVGNLNAWKM